MFKITGIRCAILLECWRVRPQNEAEDQRRKPIPRREDFRLGLNPEQSCPNIVSQAKTYTAPTDLSRLIAMWLRSFDKGTNLKFCIDWLDRLENETQVYTEGAARFIYGHGRQNQDWKKLKWREPPRTQEHRKARKWKLQFFFNFVSFLFFNLFWVLGCSFWCCMSFLCHLCFCLLLPTLKLSCNCKGWFVRELSHPLSPYVESSTGPI